MDHFTYRDRSLHCEDVPVRALAAAYGTPLWVYSRATLLHHLRQLQTAFAPAKPLICYSIKTNPSLAIARLMQEHGTGFDVTSGGELFKSLKAGGVGEKMVYAGTGKTDPEIRFAIESNVKIINAENDQELAAIARVAEQMGRRVNIALRVNPDVDPKTHAKTTTGKRGTKFGMDWDRIVAIASEIVGHRWVALTGIHMHLGSPINTTDPYRDALERAVPLIDQLRKQGHDIQYLNTGGGFGINYRGNEALPAEAFAKVILPVVERTRTQLILEPGRFIVGNAGILLTRVIFTKDSGGKHFIIQDGGMSDLIRPTLYESYHRMGPAELGGTDISVCAAQAGMPVPPWGEGWAQGSLRPCDVVGPICESGDFFAKDRLLPPMARGDLLAIFSAGAYGMAMSSNYNGRCRAAEVMIDGTQHRLIRRRETYEDLIRAETEV
jgi:diaminopimelate decarboxylase